MSAVILELVTHWQLLPVPCRIAMVTSSAPHTPHSYNLNVAPSQCQETELLLGRFHLGFVCYITTYTRTWRNYTHLLNPLIMCMPGDCFLNIPKYCNSQSIGNIDPNCFGRPKKIQKENEHKKNQQQHFQYYSHFSLTNTLLWALQK